MLIGVISDTHGLLRQEVLSHLRSCDVILHGGDINRQDILETLRAIAPLYVVRGNNDKEWAEGMPVFEDFILDGIHVYMTHKKKDLPEDLSKFDLIITGHTHRYEEKTVNDIVFLNPGSCGPRKETQPITMALVSIDDGQISIQKIDIPHRKE